MNNRYNPYPIRFAPEERRMLKEIASHYDRSQQSTVRQLVRAAHAALVAKNPNERSEKTEPAV